MKGAKASGKTETLKELGKLIGNYVLVFNCSEHLTHSSIVRMLSGLAQVKKNIYCYFFKNILLFLIFKVKFDI